MLANNCDHILVGAPASRANPPAFDWIRNTQYVCFTWNCTDQRTVPMWMTRCVLLRSFDICLDSIHEF